MKFSIAIVAVLFAGQCLAQTTKPAFVRGGMDIAYNTRNHADGNPVAGDLDVYTLRLDVCDSAVLKGRIEYVPLITGMFGRISQTAALNFDLTCDVVNPANPNQTKNVGIITGQVPIDMNGTYRFHDGSVKTSVYAIGRATAFDSKFDGTTIGKPLLKADSLLSRIKRQAVEFTKSVNGRVLKVTVDKYDLMAFRDFRLAAGPVLTYPDATVNGDMIYDYEKGIWYFKDVKISYSLDGKDITDKLSGDIRWVEQPRNGATRDGEYQFDVRVNEPAVSEASAFAATADESAFFQSDDTVPSLNGSMKYKDTFSSRDSVVASAITIDLTGNKLTRQQCMNLTKLIMLACIVPMNAE